MQAVATTPDPAQDAPELTQLKDRIDVWLRDEREGLWLQDVHPYDTHMSAALAYATASFDGNVFTMHSYRFQELDRMRSWTKLAPTLVICADRNLQNCRTPYQWRKEAMLKAIMSCYKMIVVTTAPLPACMHWRCISLDPALDLEPR
jgi:hypothetical protein